MTNTMETHAFQTEVKQLLHLMVHSLYSNKEIFLRELISNASDASDKLRFLSLEDESLLEDDPEIRVRISFDEKKNTLTLLDNGIGMNKDEVIANLGTIAKSGTAAFVEQLTGDQKKDSSLIGQFGVGFYSAFIVADKVDVYSRKAGTQASEGIHWISTGDGSFQTEPCERPQRGTEITLHLKDDAKEFASEYKLKSLIQQFSDHISLPVQMYLEIEQPEEDLQEEAQKGDDGQTKKKKSKPKYEWQTVNQAKALWTRPKSDINDDEYKAFYKHVAHGFDDPIAWAHNKVEGKLEYTSLLFIPQKAPFDLWNRDFPRGLKLYIQRVFILDKAEQFLPLYLRFVKGIIDSGDLPLNVSREMIQEDDRIESMRSALTKRILTMLDTLSTDEPDKYQAFWNEFGLVMKEGIAEDFNNKDSLLKLLRFASTSQDSESQSVSLADYVSRMTDTQDAIYYLVGESWDLVKSSPHLEKLRANDVEVLLLSDRVDEWFMGFMHEFEGKQFKDIAQGNLDISKLDTSSEEEKKVRDSNEKQVQSLIERLKKQTGDQLKDIRVSHQLVDSPACLVRDDGDMGAQMRKIMEAAGQKAPETKPILEINPSHTLIKQLDQEVNEARFDNLTGIIIDQARLSEGEILKDPAGYVRRVNSTLSSLLMENTSKS